MWTTASSYPNSKFTVAEILGWNYITKQIEVRNLRESKYYYKYTHTLQYFWHLGNLVALEYLVSERNRHQFIFKSATFN